MRIPTPSSSSGAENWISSFRRDGYVRLEKLISPVAIQCARRRIDRDLAESYELSRQVEYDNHSYCPGIRDDPAIAALLNDSAARTIVDQALGWNRIRYDHGQIAIRKAHNSAAVEGPWPHIDGIPGPSNGVVGNEIASFSALVGVFLTDVYQEFAGNFVVWPGSHYILEKYFRDRGPVAIQEGMPRAPLGDPVQLMCSTGDVVFCHYQLAHAAAVNLSGNDRYAVFFRIALKDIEKRRWEYLTHIWSGWRI